MNENDIEKHLKKQIRKINGLCFKFVSPGTRAVPDRIVIFKCETYFIELKRPGEKPRKDQLKMARNFEEQGVKVYILDSKLSVDHFILKMQVGDLKHEMSIT